ncbi:hypothetical protein MKW98_031621, partial [Papaver atlanticum]
VVEKTPKLTNYFPLQGIKFKVVESTPDYQSTYFDFEEINVWVLILDKIITSRSLILSFSTHFKI